MVIIKGRMYVPGTLYITPAALARLKEMGVVPPVNRWPQGGDFDSFFLPEGEDGAVYELRPGNPAVAGELSLVAE